MMTVSIVIWATMLVLGASAVWALVWSIRTGQLRDFQGGAASIFDQEEPIGVMTDHFPGRKA